MNSRLLYIDKLKALAMMLVVMGHTIYFCMFHEELPKDHIFNVICTFHVPLFFFLSGFVITIPPSIKKFLMKARKFLVPMLVVGFINALLINKVMLFFLNGGHNGYWYLLTLTLFYMMLILFQFNKSEKKYKSFCIDVSLALSVWVLFYLSMRLSDTVWGALNPWGAFAFWPFFIIGFLCRKYKITYFLIKSLKLTSVFTISYLFLVIVFFYHLNHLPVYLDFIIALIAIASFVGIFSKFENSYTWIDKQLLLIGNHTLGIYIYHYFFIRFINIDFLTKENTITELLFISILTIMIVYSSIGVDTVINKLLERINRKKIIAIVLLVFLPISSFADAYDDNNYQPKNTSVKIDKTNLPIVFINTQEQIIHKDYRIAARMKIINNSDGINYGDTIAYPDQKVDYEGWIGIKYRGNSSFDMSPKKPLGFKTLKTNDVDGKKEKVAIMGMPSDNDWVLMAPYNDRSMIRDVLMFQLARPYFEYTPRARHCEVILDGIYYGVYIMSERPRKGKNRLNLDDPGTSGDELTGGYQLEIDRNDEDHWYTSKYEAVDKDGKVYSQWNHIHFLYKHPEYDEMMPDYPEQLEYIHNQIDKMEDALASDNFTDPDEGYRKYLDPMSFIDYQLSQEISNNIDGYRLSTTIYKHRDSKDPHFKTAIWDFNIAFGNADYCGAYKTDFWVYQNTYLTSTNAYQKVPFWWMRLMEDPEYVTQLKARWKQYRDEFYSDNHIEQTIDSLVNELNVCGARERNDNTWPVWNVNVWPVPNWQTVNTLEKEINYLKTWLWERIAWMDEQLDYTPDTGIEIIHHNGFDKAITGYYNLLGTRLINPQKGIVVVRYKDGTSRKIIIYNE